MFSALRGLFGSSGERALRGYRRRLAEVNAHAEAVLKLDDAALRGKTAEFKTRLQNGEAAEKLLPEAFAVCREASARALKMRHFDAQIIGGMALFDGQIAEMKTGEGKTLAATLPAYLEALHGEGVHVVTVNDYLARRDAEWMGAVYQFLGLEVGVNLSTAGGDEKRAAYAADITYGTNNQFGFDYLRDNMRYDAASKLQRGLRFAIVDEVDSILIDEARTPLIISGEAEELAGVYESADDIAAGFTRASAPEKAPSPLDAGPVEAADGDFSVDEKTREVHLTEPGFEKAEKIFAQRGLLKGESLYAGANLQLLHHLNAALRARHIYERDRDYVVQDGQVIIVDEFTGRLSHGRRWGEGLHQAIEAKEKIPPQKESQTLAATSFQNYFRLYKKLAGMTGTAATESEEFKFIYNLEVVSVPTHRPMIRADDLDRVYRTAAGKERAIIKDIREARERGQPVLAGTASIESSEKLSAALRRENLPHEVLNAKQHEREAHIIAQAGRAGAITIATNMAGRGTDIILGGNPDSARAAIDGDENLAEDEKQKRRAALDEEWQGAHKAVVAAGGLRVLGCERHESRRIDNQLRGRSGRQGDPGASVFYLSFEDALLRVFATERVASLMQKLQIEEDEAIEARLVSRTIENAQRRVEAHYFDARKGLLQYDDIANEQRALIYEQREAILNAEDINAIARDFRGDWLEGMLTAHLPPETPEEEWRLAELESALAGDARLPLPVQQWAKDNPEMARDALAKKVTDAAEEHYAEKISSVEAAAFARFTRSLILNVLDNCWRVHLSVLDHLRRSIGFRGMAQKNPMQEYKREAFEMFQQMLERIRGDIARVLYGLKVQDQPPPPPPPIAAVKNIRHRHDESDSPLAAAAGAEQGQPAAAPRAPSTGEPTASPPARNAAGVKVTTYRRETPKVRRNDPCPCGSGKKYKQCCGKI